MIDRSLFWFWGRVDASSGVVPGSLGIFRWVFGLYLLLFDARWFSWVDRTPDAFFDPPLFSLAYLVGGFPPAPILTAIDVLGVFSLFAMTWGWRTRLTTSIALITYVISSTFAYSHGKISHQIAIVLVLTCMIVADWGRASPRRVAQGLSLFAIALCFGFFVAGFEKARYWLNPDLGSSGILSWYYPRMEEREPVLLAGLVPGTSLVLLKAADFTAVAFELSGLLWLLMGRVPWRLWLLAATSFHLANALVLNITFTTQVVAYLAFVSLCAIPFVRRFARWTHAARWTAIAVAAVAACWHVASRIAGGGSSFILGGSLAQIDTYDLAVCVTISLAVIALFAMDIVRELRQGRRFLPQSAASTSTPATSDDS